MTKHEQSELKYALFGTDYCWRRSVTFVPFPCEFLRPDNQTKSFTGGDFCWLYPNLSCDSSQLTASPPITAVVFLPVDGSVQPDREGERSACRHRGGQAERQALHSLPEGQEWRRGDRDPHRCQSNAGLCPHHLWRAWRSVGSWSLCVHIKCPTWPQFWFSEFSITTLMYYLWHWPIALTEVNYFDLKKKQTYSFWG